MSEPPAEDRGRDAGPSLGLGGPASAAWREEALTRAMELEGLAKWLGLEQGTVIARQIDRARSSAEEGKAPGTWRWLKPRKRSRWGASVERTLGSLDAVETDLLRLAPDDYVRGLMPSLEAHVNRYLAKDDPRRMRLVSLVKKAEDGPLCSAERGAAIAAYHAANSQRRRELLRLHTFRNVLFGAATLMLVVAVSLGVLGALRDDLIPLCFVPDEKVVCPTEETALAPAPPEATVTDIDETIAETVDPWDLALVEIIGMVAAGVASAFALRGIRGTSTPYGLPVALASLKLATGALTAFLGLLLMRGGFVPGLSALDSSAQILSWAIVFGYAQQLFTRFVDQQANNVLGGVGGRGAAGDRPSTQRAV